MSSRLVGQGRRVREGGRVRVGRRVRVLQRGSWVVIAVLLVGALAIGGRQGSGSPTAAQRAHRLASEVRCPECRELSAADSDAAAARAVRQFISEQVQAGRSDAQIRGALVARYGTDILLKPQGSGVAAVVWVLPVAVFVVTVAGLTSAFRRWRRRSGRGPSPVDRAIVEEALRG